jgi:putative salt-induced outer membrane protein
MLKSIALGVMSVCSGVVVAAEAPIVATPEQQFEADVSYLLNSSKTDGASSDRKQNLTANALWKRMQGVWGQEVKAQAVSSQSNQNNDDLERYLLSGKLMHQQTPSVYQFAKLQLEKDLNTVFDYQATLSAGVGYDFVRDDVQVLTGELGAGVRYNNFKDQTQKDTQELVGTAGVHYERKLTDTTRFVQDLGYEYGEDASILRSKTEVSVAISKQISGVVSYQVKDTMADAADARDTVMAVGIKYKH